MRRDFEVIIVGTGVIGSVMAALLVAREIAASGRVAILVDRNAPAGSIPAPTRVPTDWGSRVFALSRASQRLLQACGVWQSLSPEHAFAYERMCVWDASGAPQGKGSLTFTSAEMGEPNLGHIVEGRALQERCLAAATAAGAVIIEASVREIITGEAEVRVCLDDGRDLCGALLIGADGNESKVRRLLDIDTAGHAYNQDALVAHVRTARPHQNTAWQRFLPTGPLAFLPLPDGRSSIVWSTVRGEAERLRALDPAAFAAALDEASAEALGKTELSTPLSSYPLKLQYAAAYVRPRAVLLGDAAHVVHPLAGQGLNMGLLDCASLADVLGAAGNPALLGDYRLLRRYERWRRSENLLAATAFDGLERLFSNANPALARLRATGLGAVGKLPFIKRQFAEQALGVNGDVPAFLKGDQAWQHR